MSCETGIWAIDLGDRLIEWRADPLRATAGPGKTFLWAPKQFHGAPLGRKFLIFFSKWNILAYFIFLAHRGTPKCFGTQGSLPPYLTLSRGLMASPDLWTVQKNSLKSPFWRFQGCSRSLMFTSARYDKQQVCTYLQLFSHYTSQ